MDGRVGRTKRWLHEGMGPKDGEAEVSMESRDLMIYHMNGRPVAFTFDVSNDSSLIVVITDEKKYSTNNSSSDPPHVAINRVADKKPRTMEA